MVGFLIVLAIVMLETPVQVGSVEDTQLRVYLVEADTGLGRSGIEVAVTYGNSTMTKSCGFRGQFYCWFNLGLYTGNVTITTGATLEFKSSTTTVSVRSEQNEVTMKLYRQEIPWNLILTLILVIGIAFLIVVVLRKKLPARAKLQIVAAIYGFHGTFFSAFGAFFLVASLLRIAPPGIWGLSMLIFPLGFVFLSVTYGILTRKPWARRFGLALSILVVAYCSIPLFLALTGTVAWLMYPERFSRVGISILEPACLAFCTANLLCIYYLTRPQVKEYLGSALLKDTDDNTKY